MRILCKINQDDLLRLRPLKGRKPPENGHGTGSKSRFFVILTPLRNFLVYQHNIPKFAYELCGYFCNKNQDDRFRLRSAIDQKL